MRTTERPYKRLYSVSETGTYLGRTVCAIREMIWAGKLPYVRIDRRIFLDVKDLDAFIGQNKVAESTHRNGYILGPTLPQTTGGKLS